jgi:hypothetical protein
MRVWHALAAKRRGHVGVTRDHMLTHGCAVREHATRSANRVQILGPGGAGSCRQGRVAPGMRGPNLPSKPRRGDIVPPLMHESMSPLRGFPIT